MRKTLTIIGLVVALLWAGAAVYYWDAGAQDASPFPSLDQIAQTADITPEGMVVTTTYATTDDAARVAVRVTDTANPILEWGRITTVGGIDNVGLGIVPAWKPPVDFDLPAFIEATGCADARLAETITPRADTDTNELGWTADFQQPAADHPISGQLALCLTATDQIVQVSQFWLTDGEPVAPTAELVAAVVDRLDAPDPDATPDACDVPEGEFTVQIVDEDCQ